LKVKKFFIFANEKVLHFYSTKEKFSYIHQDKKGSFSREKCTNVKLNFKPGTP